MNRQPDDVGVRPFEALAERAGHALDRVASRLVDALSDARVALDFVLADGTKRDRGALRVCGRVEHVRAVNDEASRHVVCSAREQPQHAARVVLVPWLAEQLALHVHDGVSAEKPTLARVAPRPLKRADRRGALLSREPRRERVWTLAGLHALVDLDREHLERNAALLEQLRASR